MTDRNPASPVEERILAHHNASWFATGFDAAFGFDTHQQDPEGCIACGHLREFAALQAQDHTITKGGLDVERLLRIEAAAKAYIEKVPGEYEVQEAEVALAEALGYEWVEDPERDHYAHRTGVHP